MAKSFSKIVCFILIFITSSCGSSDDDVYVETILGYWQQNNVEILVETTSADASLLLKNYYLSEDAPDKILFFGEEFVLRSYKDANDENPEVSIYTMNGKRIAVGSFQGLCIVKVIKDTMLLEYDNTPYVTAEDLRVNLDNAGYEGIAKVDLLKKMYKWRFIRAKNPFPSAEEES